MVTVVATNTGATTGTAKKLTGVGSHLTSGGDFLLGNTSSNFMFFSPDSGEFTFKAPVVTSKITTSGYQGGVLELSLIHI